MRVIRRLLLLVAITVVTLAVARGRRPLPTGDAPAWPPLDVNLRGDPSPTVATAAVERTAAVADAVAAVTAAWVEPVDGECPPGYPVKLNLDSGIFHVPGGRSYARTRPERCYATPEDAEADGFRRAKL
ncbi:MAG: hypothetical protein QM733_13065 [Ilumatobacteraceae bacterium]